MANPTVNSKQPQARHPVTFHDLNFLFLLSGLNTNNKKGNMGEKLTCIDRCAHTWNRRRNCKRRWKQHCWEYMSILFEGVSLVLDLNRTERGGVVCCCRRVPYKSNRRVYSPL